MVDQIAGLLLLSGAGILGLNGLLLLYPLPSPRLLGYFFLLASMVWLVASTGIFYVLLKKEVNRESGKSSGTEPQVSKGFSETEVSLILVSVVTTVLALMSLNTFSSLVLPSDVVGTFLTIGAILWLYGSFIFFYKAMEANIVFQLLFRKYVLGPFMDARVNGQKPLEVSMGFLSRTDSEERTSLLFAIVSIILALNAIILGFIRSSETLLGTYLGRIFEVVALVWLLGALFFIYGALNTSRLVEGLKESHGIRRGEITYVDHAGDDAEVLFSEKYGLRGKPDYVLAVDGQQIPVEIKSGRMPRGPLFSHILQVGGYCLLIEETTGTRPDHGILRYGDQEHKIIFDARLKDTVVEKLEVMREVMRGRAEAHRNHNKPGKCAGCSRRAICNERLA